MKKPCREGKICVVVGTVTDDVRALKIPKLSVSIVCVNCLLRYTCRHAADKLAIHCMHLFLNQDLFSQIYKELELFIYGIS